VLKDRNVRTRDNRRGSGRELPPQTSKIVIDLRRRHRAKHESGSILENTSDLRVECISAVDLLLRLEKRAVCGVELSYRGRASCGISLPEYLEQVPFHQRTKCRPSRSEHAVRVGARNVRRDQRRRVFRVANELQGVPMFDCRAVGVELVDVDAGDSRIIRVIVEEIQKVDVCPYIVAGGDNAVDDDAGPGAFPCDLAEETCLARPNRLQSAGCAGCMRG
jgi:hypothetical protein